MHKTTGRVLALLALATALLLGATAQGAAAAPERPAKAFGVQAPAHPFSIDAYAVAYYISVAELGCYLEDCNNGPRYWPVKYAAGHYGTAHVVAFTVRHVLTGAELCNVYVIGVGTLGWQVC